VKRHWGSVIGLACWCLVFSPGYPGEKRDNKQEQSEHLPKPKWLKLVDQGRNDPRLKGYLTPQGIKLQIVADSPVVVNPVGMSFGDDGKLYVLEWEKFPGGFVPEYCDSIRYKDGSTRNLATLRKVMRDKKGKVTRMYRDRVKVLSAAKGKGFYDEAKVILEEEMPSTILRHDGWLYLAGRGTVRRYKQRKTGGSFDVREVVAQGFGGLHHSVSGLTIGNDGWLYISAGDGDNVVEGSDGSRASVYRTGAVFRCRPDGSKMQVYSLGFRNPYRDVAFDGNGNILHVDSGLELSGKGLDPEKKFSGCRLLHVVEECDFGWRLQIGAGGDAPDVLRSAVLGEVPGKMPALFKTGPGAPGGLFIYNETRLPERFRGLLYYSDMVRKSIRAYRVVRRGATFKAVEAFDFLTAKDPLFRPCQMVLGPDGAMYICDWRSNCGSAGQWDGDNKHGRIYRVSWAGTGKKTEDGEEEQPALPLRGMDSWAKITGSSDNALLNTLASEEFSFRQRAQRELVRRGFKQRPALLKLVADPEETLVARIAALGALQPLWNPDVETAFCKLLAEGEADLRRLAAEALALHCARGDKNVQSELLPLLDDTEPAVRRAAALAIGRIAAPGAADALGNAFQFDNGKDRFLHNGLISALERLGKPGIEKLLDLANSGIASERDKVVDAFLALRTKAALPFLESMLANPHLSTSQRARLVRSFGNYLLPAGKGMALDPTIPLKPMVAYLTRHLKDNDAVKRAGVEVLASSCSLDDKSRAWLLSLLKEENYRLQQASVQLLGQESDGAKLVGREFLAKKLPRKLLPDVIQALQQHAAKQPEVAAILARVRRGAEKK
jgi:putative membrane-bound dehydrogenase-like protein